MKGAMNTHDPIPEWLTVKEVADRWRMKFNIPADEKYVLKCYGELRFHFPNPKKRSVIDYVPYSQYEFLKLVEAGDGFEKFLDVVHELPRFEATMLRVRRDDLLAFETRSGSLAGAAAHPPTLAHAGTVLLDEQPRNSIDGGGVAWIVEDVAPLAQTPHPQNMDVISLSEALNFIALNIDVPKGRTSADDEPMWRASEAAKTLYECLHNATGTRPRWMEVHPTIGKPLASDAVSDEGMSILLHAAGRYDRETTARTRHTLDCVKAGFDPAVVGPAPRDPNAGQWDYGTYWMREHQIGFVRDELSAFLGMHIGEISIGDQEEARAILGQRVERLDRIAWAMVTLASDGPVQNETRYRQILGVTKWLESLGLQYRTGNSLPASQPKGVSVAGIDVREYQYLAVADVRAAAIEAHCWPIAEQEAVPTLPVAGTPQPATVPPTGNDRLEAMAEFVRMHVEEEQRVQRIEAEFPELFREIELVNHAVAIGTARAQASRADEQPLAFDLSLVGKTRADWHAMSADERERTRNNVAFTRQSMQQAEQERTARHAAGRYTLLEAAGFIARATHTNTDTVLGEMHSEAESHGLPVYMPGASNACAWPNEDYGDLCHVLAADLNRFIAKYHPGDFRFPEPESVEAGSATAASTPASDASKTEIPEERQRRRLARFREMGANLERAGGGKWWLTGRRGMLSALSREEKAAGRARWHASDIRKELERAAEAEYREQIGS